MRAPPELILYEVIESSQKFSPQNHKIVYSNEWSRHWVYSEVWRTSRRSELEGLIGNQWLNHRLELWFSDTRMSHKNLEGLLRWLFEPTSTFLIQQVGVEPATLYSVEVIRRRLDMASCAVGYDITCKVFHISVPIWLLAALPALHLPANVTGNQWMMV